LGDIKICPREKEARNQDGSADDLRQCLPGGVLNGKAVFNILHARRLPFRDFPQHQNQKTEAEHPGEDSVKVWFAHSEGREGPY
jgi:hypothetical protein